MEKAIELRNLLRRRIDSLVAVGCMVASRIWFCALSKKIQEGERVCVANPQRCKANTDNAAVSVSVSGIDLAHQDALPTSSMEE